LLQGRTALNLVDEIQRYGDSIRRCDIRGPEKMIVPSGDRRPSN
jgi:hypothetical protein